MTFSFWRVSFGNILEKATQEISHFHSLSPSLLSLHIPVNHIFLYLALILLSFASLCFSLYCLRLFFVTGPAIFSFHESLQYLSAIQGLIIGVNKKKFLASHAFFPLVII